MAKGWDQSQFDAALKRLGATLSKEKLPRAVTKKAFFVALRAIPATPKKDPSAILRELEKPVTLTAYHSAATENLLAATRGAGRTSVVPIGWILAAKIVGKTWPEQRMRLGEKNKSGRGNEQRAYLSAIAQKFKQIVARRKRGAGFLRVGWLSVVKLLGPFVRSRNGAPRVDTKGLQITGAMKGAAQPAKPGWLPTCRIENRAQARSDRKGGLLRYGTPGLQKAFDEETADTVQFLDREIKPEIDQANKDLK